MTIITLAHQKGGVGKTTLALNLAFCFSHSGLSVAITDTDLQGSITNFQEMIDTIELVNLKNISTTKKDILIIDTPPYLSNELPNLFKISDFILIPTKAGYLDAMAIKSTIAIINQVKKEKTTLKAAIVLNMIKQRATINEKIKTILSNYDIPTLQTIITDRVSYASSPITNSIFGSDDDKAQNEIIELANEISNILR